ncbi:hypothetical protein EDD15DRAFT_2420200 [Pisolithus albus]|nr:hypothetical protein EDD15DRAFT_2420200 [Pisolithus albus]
MEQCGLPGVLDSALWYSQSAGTASYDRYLEQLWKPWQDPADNVRPWVDTSDNSFDYPPYYPLLLSLDWPPLPIEHSSQRGDGESSLGSIPVQLPLLLAPGPRVNDRYLSPVPSLLNDTTASIAGLPSSHHAERRVLCGRVELLAQEAAHVISSLAYGSEITLSSLLHANAHQEVVRALTNPHALHDPRLKAALARGLRVLANSMADVVGHSHGPICAYTSEHLAETKVAFNFHFEYECLDVYFPLLDDSSPQTSLSIAQLIGAAVLTDAHRTAIIEWLPPPERQKEVKNHGGWEKHDLIYQVANGKHGAWVLHHLIGMTQRKDVKVSMCLIISRSRVTGKRTQEVALSALGALAMDNPTVANILAKTSLEAAVPTLNLVLAHAKSRVTSVQLAASLCATHIIRAQGNHHPGHSDRTTALSVIQVVNRILSSPSEQPQNQIKACYTLYSLVRDKRDFCIEAADHGVLASLASLVKSLTPLENTCDWEIDEPEYRATLKAIAAISLFDKVIKREVADTYDLMPIIQACLTQKNVGVRCSACHCLRSLSRDTAVIRTNITDSGAGMALYRMFKEDEDVRVTAVRWPRSVTSSTISPLYAA